MDRKSKRFRFFLHKQNIYECAVCSSAMAMMYSFIHKWWLGFFCNMVSYSGALASGTYIDIPNCLYAFTSILVNWFSIIDAFENRFLFPTFSGGLDKKKENNCSQKLVIKFILFMLNVHDMKSIANSHTIQFDLYLSAELIEKENERVVQCFFFLLFSETFFLFTNDHFIIR